MKRWLAILAAAALLAPLGATAINEELYEYGEEYAWAEDDYGYYDENFAWDAGDEFDRWYADSDTDWANFYDDVGDEGLFDV